MGFDVLNIFSEETIEPEKNVPKGIIGTQLICLFLYCFVSISVNGVENLSSAIQKSGNDPSTAIADTFAIHGMNYMSILIAGTAIIGLTPSVLMIIMGSARTFRALSIDGLLPEYFSHLDEKTQVPTRAAWFTCFVSVFSCTFLDLDTLATLGSVGLLVVFSVV